MSFLDGIPPTHGPGVEELSTWPLERLRGIERYLDRRICHCLEAGLPPEWARYYEAVLGRVQEATDLIEDCYP